MHDIELDPTTKKNVEQWLHGHYDSVTKNKIQRLLKEDPKEIENSFYTNLSFGTGGLRGVMGVGSNRMNLYTVGAATQGVANHLKKENHGDISVFIGYDSRHMSKEFAHEAARVFAGNGIKAYLCKELRPTPFVSFGCRHFHCDGAVMITASHNPPEYNGYKVYGPDGGQVLPPHDLAIIQEFNEISDPTQVIKAESLDDPLIELVGGQLDELYYETLEKLQNTPKVNQDYGSNLKIVFSSLHGTGITQIPETLKRWGFTHLTLVEEQMTPNGDFPTVHYPNPEEKEALALGIQKLKEIEGDLLIATDPDADRVGVAIMHKGQIHLLNGNQIACICLYHLLQNGNIPSNGAFVKTIATTELFRVIAEKNQKLCFDTLTGFKYIAQLMDKWERSSDGPQFIFGGEESYGYLLGTHAHDKDATISAALICEAANCAKKDGKTLLDVLYEIFDQYGIYWELLEAIQFEEGKEGHEKIERGMKRLRENTPRKIGDEEVIRLEDYQSGESIDFLEGTQEELNLAKSNVLVLWLEDGTKLMVRPSGTEPKLKIYCGVVRKNFEDRESGISEAKAHARKMIETLHHVIDKKE